MPPEEPCHFTWHWRNWLTLKTSKMPGKNTGARSALIPADANRVSTVENAVDQGHAKNKKRLMGKFMECCSKHARKITNAAINIFEIKLDTSKNIEGFQSATRGNMPLYLAQA